MNQDRLIAEISDDKIRYVIYECDKNLQYKILKKKISENIGIEKGKTLDFELVSCVSDLQTIIVSQFESRRVSVCRRYKLFQKRPSQVIP